MAWGPSSGSGGGGGSRGSSSSGSGSSCGGSGLPLPAPHQTWPSTQQTSLQGGAGGWRPSCNCSKCSHTESPLSEGQGRRKHGARPSRATACAPGVTGCPCLRISASRSSSAARRRRSSDSGSAEGIAMPAALSCTEHDGTRHFLSATRHSAAMGCSAVTCCAHASCARLSPAPNNPLARPRPDGAAPTVTHSCAADMRV